jgi:DNA polymerase III epsilon subunit-like protein
MQPLVLALAMATTGSDVSVHRVIELAVVDCATGAAFATLVTPGRMRVPSEVADATGITDAMVSGATVPGFALAAARLESAVEAWSAVRKGAPILLVGHNARRHAVRFLAAEYERSGGALPAGWRFVDTLPLAKALLPPTAAHDLAALHAHFRLGVCDARFPLGVCDARSAESAAHAVRDLLAPAVLGGLEADLTSLLLRESFSAIAAAPPPAGSGGARGVRPQAGAALQSLLEAADVQDDSVAERGDEDEGGGAGDDAEDGARRKSASRRAPKGAGAALLLPGRGLPSADPLSIVHALPGNVRLSDAARAQPTAWHETPLATCLPTADATLAGRAFSSLEALLQHVPTRFEERTGQAVLPIWPPLPGDQGGAMSEADWLRIVAAALRQAAELERSRGDWLQRVLGQRELARLRLVGGAAALQQMHAPASFADAVSARKRLAFEELFLQQVALLLRRNDALRSGTALRCPSTEAVDSVLAALLRQGKCLTAAERCALDDVLCDMADQQPMLRLLSGGAEIAYLALLAAHDAGVQGVLVAPTAAAAAQHHAQMQRLLDDAGVAPARRPPLQLLPAAEDALLRTGSTQRACVAFGTPVLLSENAAAAGAALLVVVGERCITAEQRSALCATAGEGRVPHVLTLSGAPLPRYLALAEFGDHAVSSIQLDALPAAATEPMPGSPLASLRVASLPEDAELLDEARRAAALVLRAVENRDELPPELLYALRARGLPVTEPRGAAGAAGDSGMSAAAA